MSETMIWNVLTAIATLISMFAYLITARYVRDELKSLEKDRFIAVTSELFSVWQSREFMVSQLWLLHRMEETTWREFVDRHRADEGEIAFHRVGSFYNRVGTLVRMGLINEQEILATVGGHAIAVWKKIEPLVREARSIENSALFNDFELLLPSCHECYVPALGRDADVMPFAIAQPAAQHEPQPLTLKRPRERNAGGHGAAEMVSKISPVALQRRLAKGEQITVLDVRQAVHLDGQMLPGAVVIPPDQVDGRYRDLPPDQEVVAYCT